MSVDPKRCCSVVGMIPHWELTRARGHSCHLAPTGHYCVCIHGCTAVSSKAFKIAFIAVASSFICSFIHSCIAYLVAS